MKKILIFALLVTVLITFPIFTEDGISCTGVTVVGKASIDGKTRMGQNNDGTPFDYGNWRSMNLVVNEKTGIKALYEHWGTMHFQTVRYYLNDRGVAMDHLARPGPKGSVRESASFADKDEAYMVEVGYVVDKYPDVKRSWADQIPKLREKGILVAEYGSGGIYASNALEHAHTAKEAVDIVTQGLPEGTYGVVTIRGDAAFGHANHYMYTLPSSHPFNVYGSWGSELRAARAQELLDARFGSISTPYLFSVLRDQTALGNENGDDRTYPGGRSKIARWGYLSRSRFSRISEISKKHTDLLSVHWTSPNFPPLSPYLPFYIGLTEIPPTFAHGKENKTEIFEELCNAVQYKMSYMKNVQEFWEAFEHQTIREMLQLERDVQAMVKDGDRKGAEQLLYRFCNAKCEQAVIYAKELTERIASGQDIMEMTVEVGIPIRSWE